MAARWFVSLSVSICLILVFWHWLPLVHTDIIYFLFSFLDTFFKLALLKVLKAFKCFWAVLRRFVPVPRCDWIVCSLPELSLFRILDCCLSCPDRPELLIDLSCWSTWAADQPELLIDLSCWSWIRCVAAQCCLKLPSCSLLSGINCQPACWQSWRIASQRCLCSLRTFGWWSLWSADSIG